MTGIWWVGRHQGGWRYLVMQRNVHDNKVTGCKASVEVEFRRPPCWKHPTSWFCKMHKLKVKAWATGKKPGSPQQPSQGMKPLIVLGCCPCEGKTSSTTQRLSSLELFVLTHGEHLSDLVGRWLDSHTVDKSFGPTVRGYSHDIPILTNGMNTIRAFKCIRQFLPGV